MDFYGKGYKLIKLNDYQRLHVKDYKFKKITANVVIVMLYDNILMVLYLLG